MGRFKRKPKKEIELNNKDKESLKQMLMDNPYLLVREINNRSFYEFMKWAWPEIISEDLVENWHMEYICAELQQAAERVGENKPRLYDLLINVPPGTSKTSICLIFFPVWCWTRWYYLRFITASYSAALSLESAEASRDLIRSERFKAVYPELVIKEDKDTKSNYRVVKLQEPAKEGHMPRQLRGGNRFSTSVGGSLTGFHGHINIIDDPINPQKAVSTTELDNTNRWMDHTLPTRKVDKKVTLTIIIMQRLHENDPSGHLLKKGKKKIKHICLPGECVKYGDMVKPALLKKYYVNGLLDANRLGVEELKELEYDLGQYGYAGQVGQNPVPPTGGMFQVDNFIVIEKMPAEVNIESICRYWDKAGTKEALNNKSKKGPAYTVGTKMCKLKNGKYIVMHVKRGRWESHERERLIRMVAEADGKRVPIYHEQEPGSGGKQSAQETNRNLDGFHAEADRPQGDKIFRADPYSVQVNEGNVMLLRGDWNHDFIEEHRFFPLGTYKDQVDSASGAYSKLSRKKKARSR